MLIKNVQYSEKPSVVSMTMRPDGCAEYRLTKNVQAGNDTDGNTVITADEVYFEVGVDLQKPSISDVEGSFDSYWDSGIQWPKKEPTQEERIAELEEALRLLLEGKTE